MSLNPASVAPEQTVAVDSSRRGRLLLAVQSAWLAVAVLGVGLFVASVPVYYEDLQSLSAEHMHAPEAVRAGLDEMGISVRLFAALQMSVLIAIVAVFAGVGGVIFWRKRDDPVALFVSFALVTFGIIWPNTLDDLVQAHPGLAPASALLNAVGFTSFFLLAYLFPDGRFIPRWTWIPAAFLVLGAVADLVLPQPLPDALFLWVPITLLYAPVYRYRRASSPVQRQQIKWVLFSLVVAIGSFVGYAALEGLPAVSQPGVPAALYALGGSVAFGVVFLLVPISIGIAVLRYRLWDIDPLINRTLVYGALTAGVIGIYVLVVGWLGVLFRRNDNLVFSLIATGIVAVLFQPMRQYLQRTVNRMTYGERDDPYSVISRLGQRLEGTLAADTILPTIVSTVTEALRLPYAAIVLHQAGDDVAAAAGAPTPNPIRLPLVYQHEPVGELLVAPRGPDEPFSPADRRLLDDLARQAGIAAHAVRLNAELQRARERLVEAREEERRRLRRDLHDGLGSQLAALSMQAGTLRGLIASDPNAAMEQAREIREELRAAIGSIRQIAYNLRPPILDEYGLLVAIRERVRQCSAEGLLIEMELPDSLPRLSAAAEVALYRTAEEALTNVVRHAGASHCILRLSVETDLELTITDNGRGIEDGRTAGIGLLSMRERAEEIGGTCVIEPDIAGGTRVHVRLPVVTE